jgi:hypothetical protein
MSAMKGRWIAARTSGRAHLDLGERSSQSLRVRSDHVVVTACHAHIAGNAQAVPEIYELRCSNCVRIARTGTPIRPKLSTIIDSIKSFSDSHVAALDDLLKAAGGDAVAPIKATFSSIIGAGAAVDDSVRKSKALKNLRNDKVALCLATITKYDRAGTKMFISETGKVRRAVATSRGS